MWWFQRFCIFSSDFCKKWFNYDGAHIFQTGWWATTNEAKAGRIEDSFSVKVLPTQQFRFSIHQEGIVQLPRSMFHIPPFCQSYSWCSFFRFKLEGMNAISKRQQFLKLSLNCWTNGWTLNLGIGFVFWIWYNIWCGYLNHQKANVVVFKFHEFLPIYYRSSFLGSWCSPRDLWKILWSYFDLRRIHSLKLRVRP